MAQGAVRVEGVARAPPVAFAHWFGRGDARREQAKVERLDQSAGELQTAEGDAAQRAFIRLEAAWQTRIETLLEGMDEAERTLAADQLRTLLTHSPGPKLAAGDGSVAVGGTVHIQADNSSAAAWSMGDVTLGNPSQPGPRQD
ncbi:hypothetical protein [Streptomyces collinus]|uniref:hypothetical protein n=1 Tax=Streptomyces collinus TaxID=42684 RepID=UPI0036A41E5C